MKYKKQFIALLVLFLLIIVLIAGLISTLFDNRGNQIFEVAEPFQVVSSVINVADNRYEAFFYGTLENTTNSVAVVEQISFKVSVGTGTQTYSFEGFGVHPNGTYEFAKTTEVAVPVSKITDVILTVDGKDVSLGQTQSFGFTFFAQLLLLAVFIFFAVREYRAIQILKEEEQMLATGEIPAQPEEK